MKSLGIMAISAVILGCSGIAEMSERNEGPLTKPPFFTENPEMPQRSENNTVEIYTKNGCPHCAKAKETLKKLGLKITEYELTAQKDKIPEMLKRSNNATTVPQIFVNGKHIGGNSDLEELIENNKFDALLH